MLHAPNGCRVWDFEELRSRSTPVLERQQRLASQAIDDVDAAKIPKDRTVFWLCVSAALMGATAGAAITATGIFYLAGGGH
jgi:hypothetical protein